MLNYIAAPQGPAIARSGTLFSNPVNSHTEKSALVPFVFSNDQAVILEFASDRIKFHTEAGVQVYTPVAHTLTDDAPFMIVNAPGLGAAAGDDVAIGGYPSNYNLNGIIARITAKVGDNYTLSIPFPALAPLGGTVARVYHVACTYTEAQRMGLFHLQSVDVMYLLTQSRRPRKLSRYGAYDWRLEDVTFIDGPYLPVNTTSTTLTPAATGNAVPNMTAVDAPSGDVVQSGNRPATGAGTPFLGRTLTYNLAVANPWYAFDNDNDDLTYWASDQAQEGWIGYSADVPYVCDGYTIFISRENQDTTYIAKDYAPSTFVFEGSNDGVTWTLLDKQQNYVLYENNRSVFFPINNTTAWTAYRLRIFSLTRNGAIEPRIRRLTMRSTASKSFQLAASASTGINKDAGFTSTDVGRLIRLKGSDGAWRSVVITAVAGFNSVTVTLLDDPFLDLTAIREWRLGYWSDTTGWPTCAEFHEDRLWFAPSTEYPDMFAGSVSYDYERFSPTDTFGVVLDTSAVVERLNGRKLAKIVWLASDEKGLVIGTSSSEHVLSANTQDGKGITPTTRRVRNSTQRGSAPIAPVKIDNQILYVQRSKRTLREFAYTYEADGFKSPSMSQLASHLGAKLFAQLAYAAEPFSIVWARCDDGSLVGLTYNREEAVVGWHRHDLAGGIIESIAAIPQLDQLQDTLWLVVRRTVGGISRRYIERLTGFADFGATLNSAHYVDCALKYSGAPASTLYNLGHLDGENLYGVADGKAFGPVLVYSGAATLPFAASNVIIGLGYDAEVESNRLDNGAADGTAFGKYKRTHKLSLGVWQSWGGEIGVWNEEAYDAVTGEPGAYVYTKLEYPYREDQLPQPRLWTGEIFEATPSPGYERKGTVKFRRTKDQPYPLHVLYIAPQMHTQDA